MECAARSCGRPRRPSMGMSIIAHCYRILTRPNQGDVQMCALLSLVAAKELRISPTRTLRFVEAYISKYPSSP